MQISNSLDMNQIVGLSAAKAYEQLLLAHAQASQVELFRYRTPLSLQNRIKLSSSEQALIDRALEIRKSIGLPFWSAVFTSALLGEALTSQLVEAALFHNGPGEAVEMSRTEIEEGSIERVVRSGAKNVGLSSKVRDFEGVEWHLALLDFHCDVSSQNESLAALICQNLMPSGYFLIDSGDSYHACGIELLAPMGRIRMLAKALLMAPIVDSNYIAHQLQQDLSTIRVSVGGKASREPYVVRAWAPT